MHKIFNAFVHGLQMFAQVKKVNKYIIQEKTVRIMLLITIASSRDGAKAYGIQP